MLDQRAMDKSRALLPIPGEEIKWADAFLMQAVVASNMQHELAPEYNVMQRHFWWNHFHEFSRAKLMATCEALGLPRAKRGRFMTNAELTGTLAYYFQKLTEQAATPVYTWTI
jgi:hypothetical protein